MQYIMPIRTLEDMKGKRLRIAGVAWSHFAEFVGAVPVSIPASEMYSGVEFCEALTHLSRTT